MENAVFCCFIECRTQCWQSFSRVVLFAGGQEFEISSFQSMKAGLDASVMISLPRAAAHPAFG